MQFSFIFLAATLALAAAKPYVKGGHDHDHDRDRESVQSHISPSEDFRAGRGRGGDYIVGRPLDGQDSGIIVGRPLGSDGYIQTRPYNPTGSVDSGFIQGRPLQDITSSGHERGQHRVYY